MKKLSVLTAVFACAVALLFTNCSKKGGGTSPAPVANFSDSGAGLAPSTVNFTNVSTNATSYVWDFGDNTTSTVGSPSHTYTHGGVYTVKLTATGAGGSHSTSKTVNIQTPTSLKIVSVKLQGMSFTDGTGAGWDISNGPDVYFNLSDNADNVLVTGAVFNDVAAIPPVLLWTLTPSYQVTNFNSTYKIRVYDKDSPDADDFIGGYSFPFSLMASAGYPTSFVLQLSGEVLRVEVGLVWE
jgi:PKD repeat protein